VQGEVVEEQHIEQPGSQRALEEEVVVVVAIGQTEEMDQEWVVVMVVVAT
jgi:hypothetical protein